ncbi:hypothetical protein J0H58_25985 [bacterium]|nr:hypothetical protein [bacterium]
MQPEDASNPPEGSSRSAPNRRRPQPHEGQPLGSGHADDLIFGGNLILFVGGFTFLGIESLIEAGGADLIEAR